MNSEPDELNRVRGELKSQFSRNDAVFSKCRNFLLGWLASGVAWRVICFESSYSDNSKHPLIAASYL
jgi:hypothetical protein